MLASSMEIRIDDNSGFCFGVVRAIGEAEAALREHGNAKVVIPTVFTAPKAVLAEFEKTDYAARLKATGVITSYICPLMYMNNPLCKTMPVITSSNKLRTYTSARYYTDEQIRKMLSGSSCSI